MSEYKNAVCRGSWSLGSACGKCERCIETNPNKSIITAKADSANEIDELTAQLRSGDELRERLSEILTNTANALKGEPDELTLHSWHDLAEKSLELKYEVNLLREAGQALVDRWDSPKWKEQEHTGVYIDNLRKAISATEPQ